MFDFASASTRVYEEINIQNTGVKQTSAYEIIGNLNKELEEQGYLTLRGKVPTKYFVKRFYGVEDTCEIPQEEGKKCNNFTNEGQES